MDGDSIDEESVERGRTSNLNPSTQSERNTVDLQDLEETLEGSNNLVNPSSNTIDLQDSSEGINNPSSKAIYLQDSSDSEFFYDCDNNDEFFDGASSLVQLKSRDSSVVSSSEGTCSLVDQHISTSTVVKDRGRTIRRAQNKSNLVGSSVKKSGVSKISIKSQKSQLAFQRSYGIEDVVRMVLVNKLSPMESIRAGKNCVTR